MPSRSAGPPRLRGLWRGLWDERRSDGASGAPTGTSGEGVHPVLRAFAVILAFLVLVDTVNVLSALHDAARRGQDLGAWEPITWEATSGVATLIACPIIYAALRVAPPNGQRWGRSLLVHGIATVAFSAVHVVLMMGLRIAIYGALGFHYRVEAGAAAYEYRKDLLAYLVLSAVILAFTARRREVAPPVQPISPVAATFDIVEGARIQRVPVGAILAARSAGNYVEFLLDDGRRPLMRTTLRELTNQLEPHGFQRTHRSWLINAGRVRGLERAASGDHTATLDGGTQAPVSRRFPAALEGLLGKSRM